MAIFWNTIFLHYYLTKNGYFKASQGSVEDIIWLKKIKKRKKSGVTCDIHTRQIFHV